MAITRKNEEAVSPVIGVILMVAITVILAAVIAAFVFGMAGNIQKTKVVAATLSRVNASDVVVTYQGGQDAASLQSIAFTSNGANVTIAPISGSPLKLDTSNSQYYPSTGSVFPVGAVMYIPAGPGSQITGLGVFSDGSTQVIVQQTL